jgi:hypothetical protein
VFTPVLNPASNCAPRNAKQTLDTAQAEAFQHRLFHLTARMLIITALGKQCTIALTGFAAVFLVTLVIMAIAHHVFTAAFRTLMRYNRLYPEKVLQVNLAVCSGLPFHALSVKTSPLP